MNYKDALNTYKKTQVNTSDGGRLILLLYEAAIKNIDEAMGKMNYKNFDFVNEKIKKTIDIVDELILSLDLKVGEISQRLQSIYVYMNERLTEANVKKTSEPLEEVKKIFQELHEAWKTITKNGTHDPRQGDASKRDLSSGGFSVTG